MLHIKPRDKKCYYVKNIRYLMYRLGLLLLFGDGGRGVDLAETVDREMSARQAVE